MLKFWNWLYFSPAYCCQDRVQTLSRVNPDLLVLLPSFGMVHDGEGNVCKKSEGNIMSPTLAGHNGVFSWSACSRQYLSRFLK